MTWLKSHNLKSGMMWEHDEVWQKRHFPHADRRCAFFHTSLDVDNPQSSPSNTPRLLQCQCKDGVGVIRGITEGLGQDVDLGPFMSYQISRTYLLTMTFHIFYYCLNMKGQPKGGQNLA